ncbi:MAG: cobalt-zinc-cadmium resistance protein CzcA [Candidatus Angelobacter sp.]|nr:cobalt-zinc-cadmium resistance protein CzcA [Candidatus Angelobacter sp.]
MSISAPFIRRPVGTSLLALAILLAGGVAFFFLPVSPLPEVEYPTISVSAGLPGASPETMASAVATPLERQFGRIAGITEMTSSSNLGSTNVTLQFDLSRNIDAAARDVQAAINAARGQLPANLPNNPTYRKTNPADAPIMILALTSDTLPVGTMYDAADSILAQKMSQVSGVGQVSVGGGAKPAVRVQVNPSQLSAYGLGLEDVRVALQQANANSPKGQLSNDNDMFTVAADDQLLQAAKYKPLIIAYRNGAPVRLSDVANVFESQENIRNAGLANGKPAVLIIVFRQPGANIIQVVDRIKSMIPLFQASINPAIHISVATDRTTTIRASVHDVEITLLIAIALVVLVIFVFLRNLPATAIPSVAVPLSLVGTLAFMYLLNYTIDNLSLMALTIATGFVVDDAIVVIENIARYIEEGMQPFEAALRGAREIGFTVLSMSASLVAVFIPILLMGGIIGRLFRQFAIVLAIAIGVSLLVSLTVTPMMSAKFLAPADKRKHGFFYRVSESMFDLTLGLYSASLRWVLRHSLPVLFILLGTVALAVYLYIGVPKGFFPQQDTGRLNGSILAAQDISFESMRAKQAEFIRIVMQDPAVDQVVAFNGSSNRASAFIQLKPLSERKATADQIITRLRPKLSRIPGAQLFLQSVQDVRVGGRGGNAQYQYTLQGPDIQELNSQVPILLARLQKVPELRDVNSDQQNRGLESYLVVDRDTASRLGVTPQAIDAVLYDSFGQRQVSTMYRQVNQYHVVMEVQPQFANSPDALKIIYVKSNTGDPVPLSTFTHYELRNSALTVNHQGQFPATTITFNLAPGVSLGEAVTAIDKAESDIHFPADIHGGFQGTAAAFQQSLANQPLLIAAALAAVYIVLGMLYESLIHPITILSTLPSAGVGALLALLVFKTELNIIALIGIILLIGIVKKNAIMMIDFALDAERKQNLSSEEAIFKAAMLRFRPIMMTTMAALFGALPLAFGTGVGAELRRPLGITIVGGLLLSQMQTLFTTPVVYLYMDRMRLSFERWKSRRHRRTEPQLGATD